MFVEAIVNMLLRIAAVTIIFVTFYLILYSKDKRLLTR